MQTHVKLIGWLFIILGVLSILIAACISAVIFGGGLISGDQNAITATGIIAAVCAGAMILVSLPGIITGIGLLNFRNWARILGIILAFLNLFNFPLGTALGIYALVILLNDETSMLFNSQQSLITS